MRNKYIVVIFLVLSLTACAKKIGESKTKAAEGNFVAAYPGAIAADSKCAVFQAGSRLTKVEIVGTKSPGVKVHTQTFSFGQKERTNVVEKSGLLLTFNTNRTFLLEVDSEDRRMTAGRAELENALRNVILMARSKKVIVDSCTASTKYSGTKVDGLNYMNRWAHEYASEGSDSNVDGIITLGGVEL